MSHPIGKMSGMGGFASSVAERPSITDGLPRLGPHQLLDVARAALAEQTGRDLTTLTEHEVLDLAEAAAQVAQLATAAQTAAVAGVDTSRAFQPTGARSAAAWLAWRCRLPRGRANGLVRGARRVRDLPGTEAAFLAGALSPDHVTLLASCHAADPAAFAEQESLLVEHARTLAFRHFERVVRYWIERHDPDRVERDAAEAHEARRVDCSRTLDDMVVVDALLDPVTGAVFARELDRLEQALFEADWAEARARLGDAATAADLARTAKQRRADALREMAERSAARPADATAPRVLLHVLAGAEAVERMRELSDGTILTPGQVVPLLRWADVARVLFDGPSRVIDVGVRQRLFTGATRTAVELRDLECQHPAATCASRAARWTTSSPTRTAASPPRTTGPCGAPSTTAGVTDDPGRTPDRRSGSPPAPRRRLGRRRPQVAVAARRITTAVSGHRLVHSPDVVTGPTTAARSTVSKPSASKNPGAVSVSRITSRPPATSSARLTRDRPIPTLRARGATTRDRSSRWAPWASRPTAPRTARPSVATTSTFGARTSCSTPTVGRPAAASRSATAATSAAVAHRRSARASIGNDPATDPSR